MRLQLTERAIAYVAGAAALMILGAAAILQVATRGSAHDGEGVLPKYSARASLMPAIAGQSAASLPQTSMPASQGSPLNVLELPKASLDFVGIWGGYIRSEIRSLQPGLLTGENPDRASIVFGNENGTVFVAGRLYSSPRQKIAGKPRARIVNPREAIVQYQSDDAELHYSYTYRFNVLDVGRIAYRSSIEVSSRESGKAVGTVIQHGILRRLLTVDEQRRFERPSFHQVAKSEISAQAAFKP